MEEVSAIHSNIMLDHQFLEEEKTLDLGEQMSILTLIMQRIGVIMFKLYM